MAINKEKQCIDQMEATLLNRKLLFDISPRLIKASPENLDSENTA
ncbi:MAG: hypothetical protein PVI90_10905 [Desulfobacteraceae bacterium]|jgi:hypothetical protein